MEVCLMSHRKGFIMKYTLCILFVFVVGIPGLFARLSQGSVKVFVLAGQSNMEGAGKIEGAPKRNGGKGILSHLMENSKKNSLRRLPVRFIRTPATLPSINGYPTRSRRAPPRFNFSLIFPAVDSAATDFNPFIVFSHRG